MSQTSALGILVNTAAAALNVSLCMKSECMSAHSVRHSENNTVNIILMIMNFRSKSEKFLTSYCKVR